MKLLFINSYCQFYKMLSKDVFPIVYRLREFRRQTQKGEGEGGGALNNIQNYREHIRHFYNNPNKHTF